MPKQKPENIIDEKEQKKRFREAAKNSDLDEKGAEKAAKTFKKISKKV